MNCPDCNEKMIKRYRKKDNHLFYGCSKYPNCKGTRDIDGNPSITDWEEVLYEDYAKDMGNR